MPPELFANTPDQYPVFVIAEDANGNVDPDFDGPVSLTMGNNPDNARLTGTTDKYAVSGVAAFSGISVSADGESDSIEASAKNPCTGATNKFNVVPAYKIVFYEYSSLGTPQGHTFVQLVSNVGKNANNLNYVYGFGLQLNVDTSQLPYVWNVFTASGAVVQQNTYPWNWRISYPISQQQFADAIAFIQRQQANPPSYNLLTTNCMWWDAQVASVVGVTLPPYVNVLNIPDPSAFGFILASLGDRGTFDGGTVEQNTLGTLPNATPAPPPAFLDYGGSVVDLIAAAYEGPATLAQSMDLSFQQASLGSFTVGAGQTLLLNLGNVDINHALVLADFGDGTHIQQSLTPSRVYHARGTWQARVIVINSGAVDVYSYTVNVDGSSPGASIPITVSDPPFNVPGPLPPAPAFPSLPPAVSGISPMLGSIAGGTTVTITGTDLSQATGVAFGSTLVTDFVTKTDSQIVVDSPSGSAGTVDVSIQTPDGVTPLTPLDQFTFGPGALPVVTQISLLSGSLMGGQAVTITGANFAGSTSPGVFFGGSQAQVISFSTTQIEALTPAGTAGTVDVTVKTAGGTSATSAADQFTYVSAPSITGLSSSAGSPDGGNTITISGTNLLSATAVNFGVNAATIVSNSATQIVVDVPASAPGAVDVTVTTAGGVSTALPADKYTYVLVPNVRHITPTQGGAGSYVTIFGTNLSGVTAVHFGTVAATQFTNNLPNSIRVLVPAGSPGVVDVTVTTSAGTSAVSAADEFTYVAAPTVTGVSPSSGGTAGGTQITITGTNLANATEVLLGYYGVTNFVSDTSTQIVLNSPAGPAGTVDVIVYTPGGASTTSASDLFTFGNGATPTVSRVTPLGGPIAGGTSVTIYGSNFIAGSTVKFGTTPAVSVQVLSSSEITATAPAQGTMPSTVDITVATPVGTSTTSTYDQFTYEGIPTITSISPPEGPLGGGQYVTITGTNLAGATAVHFGSTAATYFYGTSPTQLAVYVPGGAAGTVDVTVTTPSGTSAVGNGDKFTYAAAPAVTTISPATGSIAGGTKVTITGTNLAGATAVYFGSTEVTSFVSNTATQIVLNSPAGSASTVDVTVDTPAGASSPSTADLFTYGSGAVPTVDDLSLTSGAATGGATITIYGSNFTAGSTVKFGGTAATNVKVLDSTRITATAPAQGSMPSSVDVTVTTAAGTSATSSSDQFDYLGVPTVSGVTPASGPVIGGQYISVTGSNLLNVTAVHFGSVAANYFYSESSIDLEVFVPVGTPGTVDVTVTTSSGTSSQSAADQYTYQAPPTITSISPSVGLPSGGTQVTITGTNLAGATAVHFGSTSVTTFVSDTATQIVLDAPAGRAGTVDVTVTTPVGTSPHTPSDHYTFEPAPILTSVSAQQGPTTGTYLILSGSHLLDASAVTFGADGTGKIISDTDSQIVVQSPQASPGTVDITITTPTGTSPTSSADQFSYVAAPTVTGVTPGTDSDSGGTAVTITGTNLANAIAVAFGNDLVSNFTSDTGNQIVLNSPAATDGTVDIEVVTAGGTSAASLSDLFTYGSGALPTVSDVTPASGLMAGGETITITGSNFSSDSTVAVGTAMATNVTVMNSSEITATVPAQGNMASTVDVTATTHAGSSTATTADQYSYVSTGTSTVSVSSASIVSSSSITVTLQAEDDSGNAIISGGLNVAFTLGGNLQGSFSSVTDNGDGTYSAIFTPSSTGSGTISATIDGQTVTTAAPTLRVSSPASLSRSLVTLSPGSVQAGNTTTITLQAKDDSGNNLTSGGLIVTFALASMGGGSGTIGAVIDNGNGSYTATFTGKLVGTNSIVATINGSTVANTAPLTVTPGPLSIANSPVTTGLASIQVGGSTVVTLQARDAYGNNLSVAGLKVVFTLHGSTSVGKLATVTDNKNGTYTAVYSGLADGSNSITATINGAAATLSTPSISVTGATVSTAKSILTVGTNTLVAGNTTTITLQAEDASGNKETSGGLKVAFALGSKTGGQASFGPVIDNGNGTYTAVVTGTLAGSNTITATIGTTKVTTPAPAFKVSTGPLSLAYSPLTVSSSSLKAGTPVTVTFQPEDAGGNKLVMPGLSVVFGLGSGTASGTFSNQKYNSNGTYTATFTPTTAGSNTIIATVGGSTVPSKPTIMVTPGAASVLQSLVGVSAGSVASGSTVTVTLQAEDVYGNKETSGGSMVLVSLANKTGGQGTFGKVTDNKNGTYTATFTGTTAGANTITATIGSARVTSTAGITVTPGPFSLARSVVTVPSATVAPNTPITVTLQVKDAAGNSETAGGLTVVFLLENSTGGTGTFGPVTDNGNGTYTTTFTGKTAGKNAIQAKINGQLVTSNPAGITIT